MIIKLIIIRSGLIVPGKMENGIVKTYIVSETQKPYINISLNTLIEYPHSFFFFFLFLFGLGSLLLQGKLIQNHGHGGPSSLWEAYPLQNQCFSFKILNKVRWWRCYMNCDRKTGGNEVKEKKSRCVWGFFNP